MKIERLDEELARLCADQFETACGYAKPSAYFERQLRRQREHDLVLWVAHRQETYLGHVRLMWHPEYAAFREAGIPEIADLNVARAHRRSGIGTALITRCEAEADTAAIGIAVGLYPGYNQAQRLYTKLGYQLDGRGVHYRNQPVQYGECPPFDDDLLLYFIKPLSAQSEGPIEG